MLLFFEDLDQRVQLLVHAQNLFIFKFRGQVPLTQHWVDVSQGVRSLGLSAQRGINWALVAKASLVRQIMVVVVRNI